MQEIKARLDIESIMFHYTSSIDSGDLESAAEVFKRGAIESPENFLDGYSEVFNTYKSVIIFYDDEDQEIEYLRLKCSPKTKHLNTNIQYLIHEELTKGVKDFSALGAAAILMDANTGKIISMVSLPDD